MYFPTLVNGRPSNCQIMGIINLTPDSFFPKSRSFGVSQAIRIAEKMIKNGADLLDVGAESSRPGAQSIPEEEELSRLLPIVTELVKHFKIPISVDTYKPSVAKQVLDSGAKIINDITALSQNPGMAEVVASRGAGIILMHMKGTPETMQNQPSYDDVVEDIIGFLSTSVTKAINAGVDSNHIAIDPGIGFGKTVHQNIDILKRLSCFLKLNKPIVLGASRKSFLKGRMNLPVEERIEASLAAAVIGRIQGASIFRVHDVKETFRALELANSIL